MVISRRVRGVFRAEGAVAAGYEIDFERRTATMVFENVRGLIYELHEDELGRVYHLETGTGRCLYFSFIDDDTVAIGPRGAPGLLLRRAAD
jgi:hypothetical protein